MKRLFIRKDDFLGIFPRKGEKCLKLRDSVILHGRSVRWLPIDGRDIVLADQWWTSKHYVHADAVADGAIPSSACRPGQQSAALVWVADCPDGVLLGRDYRITVHAGASCWQSTIPAGSRIYACDSGSPRQTATWWVVPPPVKINQESTS